MVQWKSTGNRPLTTEETIYQDSQEKFFDNDQDPTTSVGTFNTHS